MKVRNRAQYFKLFRNKLSQRDLFRLDFAYDLTKYAHGYIEQRRDSGERYFEHPRYVSGIIASFGVFDADTHIAALFHDAAEDTHLLSYDRIKFVFGNVVAQAVLAVTKRNATKENKLAYLATYFEGVRKAGWRACLIKYVDRIHNVATLSVQDERSIRKTREQLEETATYFPALLPVVERHNADLAAVLEKHMKREVQRIEKMLTKT